MSTAALLLFDSFECRDAFCCATALCADMGAQYTMHGTLIEPHCGGAVCVGMPRASSLESYATKAAAIVRDFDARNAPLHVYIFNNALAAHMAHYPAVSNNSVTVLGTNRAALLRVVRALGLPPIVQGSNDAVDASVQRAFPAVTRRVAQASDYDAAVRESLLQHERDLRAASAAALPIPLRASWEAVLRKEADPPVVGQPLCTVCYARRASVCFFECRHQTCCDECVRRIWSTPGVVHACPVCRTPCLHIVQPIVSEHYRE